MYNTANTIKYSIIHNTAGFSVYYATLPQTNLSPVPTKKRGYVTYARCAHMLSIVPHDYRTSTKRGTVPGVQRLQAVLQFTPGVVGIETHAQYRYLGLRPEAALMCGRRIQLWARSIGSRTEW